eukprot:11700285-Alexandrium_andersonii.AAC.1
MSASLVGSEMCIRDRPNTCPRLKRSVLWLQVPGPMAVPRPQDSRNCSACLLYTSDAADDM